MWGVKISFECFFSNRGCQRLDTLYNASLPFVDMHILKGQEDPVIFFQVKSESERDGVVNLMKASPT
jgi:hypothetical protein